MAEKALLHPEGFIGKAAKRLMWVCVAEEAHGMVR
jgi:hypothetical protein